MSIIKFVRNTLKHTFDESEKIKSKNKAEFDTMSAHSEEFRGRFYVAQEEIKKKQKSIQKIMR